MTFISPRRIPLQASKRRMADTHVDIVIIYHVYLKDNVNAASHNPHKHNLEIYFSH